MCAVLRPHGLPQPLFGQGRDRLASSPPQHPPQNFCLNRRVVKALPLLHLSGFLAIQILIHAHGCVGVARVVKHLSPNPVVVIGCPGVKLSKRHARRHAQQIANGGLAISRVCNFRPIVRGFVVQRANQTFAVRNAHQHGRKGFGH